MAKHEIRHNFNKLLVRVVRDYSNCGLIGKRITCQT